MKDVQLLDGDMFSRQAKSYSLYGVGVWISHTVNFIFFLSTYCLPSEKELIDMRLIEFSLILRKTDLQAG